MTQWQSPALVSDIGWVLVDFLWQGVALAGLLYLVLPICRSAAMRHNCALGTLIVMGLAPLVTFWFIHVQSPISPAVIAVPYSWPAGAVTGGGTMTVQHPALLPWLVVFWLAGVAGLSLRAVAGWCLTETWRHRDTLAVPADLRRRCADLQHRLRLSRPVQFLQSRRVHVPMVIGWFKPVVLVPASAITGLPTQQLDALILHELAHILRGDAFANLLQVVVETVLFYHPAVWWVGRQLRAAREHSCDDVAVSVCGDVATYVDALISLESSRNGPQLALAASGGKLKDRVQRLLKTPGSVRRSSASALVGLALLSLILASVATSQAVAVPVGHQSVSIRLVDDISAPGRGDDRVAIAEPGAGKPQALWLKREGGISGDIVAEAHVVTGPHGKVLIEFTFTPEAGSEFAALTRQNVGRRLAIVVNGRILTAPMVREPILSGKVQIDGNFADAAEAKKVVDEMMGTRR